MRMRDLTDLTFRFEVKNEQLDRTPASVAVDLYPQKLPHNRRAATNMPCLYSTTKLKLQDVMIVLERATFELWLLPRPTPCYNEESSVTAFAVFAILHHSSRRGGSGIGLA